MKKGVLQFLASIAVVAFLLICLRILVCFFRKYYVDATATLIILTDKGILEETKSVYQITDADIREFEKRLQEKENEKRLKEQQMDKNLTSPTSSLTKSVMLASGNSVAIDGFVDYGISNDTFSTLQIANE